MSMQKFDKRYGCLLGIDNINVVVITKRNHSKSLLSKQNFGKILKTICTEKSLDDFYHEFVLFLSDFPPNQ